jgi:hypothetical protein
VSTGDVGFTAKLLHVCEVYRRSGEKDRFGQPVDANPSLIQGTLTNTYICRVDPGKGGMTMTERSIDVYSVRYMLYTQPDCDIREDDSIRVLDPKTDEVLVPYAKVKQKNKVYDIDGPHHVEIELLSQRGPW